MVTDMQQGCLALRWRRHSQIQSRRHISEKLAAVEFPYLDFVAINVEGFTNHCWIAAHRAE